MNGNNIYLYIHTNSEYFKYLRQGNNKKIYIEEQCKLIKQNNRNKCNYVVFLIS